MNTQEHAQRSTHAVAATVLAESPRMCCCGQDLDICQGICCPRCGMFVGRAA